MPRLDRAWSFGGTPLHTLVRFAAPLLVVAAAVSGLAPASAASAPPARPTGVSFVGPVIPLDMEPTARIFPGGLYRDDSSEATAAAARLDAEGRRDSAATIRRISDQPAAVWLGDWFDTAEVKRQVARHVAAAAEQDATPVFVTYAIPNRDCGGHSAGGMASAAYLDWNRAIATALAGSDAVILVEPDSLAMLTGGGCPGERERRLRTIADAVRILSGAGVTLYLDAGHSAWATTGEMASLLRSAGVFETRGFVTNVSNFRSLDEERAYGERLSKELGGKSFVVDVSRNGNGWQGDWCNPAGAAIGPDPRVESGSTKLDAVLWVKRPGESDGTCNGGPPAGRWWEAYAMDLVRNQRAG